MAKQKYYPDTYAITKPMPYPDIHKMKTMKIDGIKFRYGLVCDMYHFYPLHDKNFDANKLQKFVYNLLAPINDNECARTDSGDKYLGYVMTIDSFQYQLPMYVYFTEQVEKQYRDLYGETLSFRDWL